MGKKNLQKRAFRLLIKFIKNPKYTLEHIRYRIQEKITGIETSHEVASKDLGITMADTTVGYEGSGDSYLAKVLKDLKINDNELIIDLGCGKGRAILCFTKFPFAKIIGIEYSPSVFSVAVSNVNKINDNRIQILQGDAGEYVDYKDINYIYMFNPFSQIIMNRVLDKICQSYKDFPHKIIIIYNNPTCHNDIESRGIFRKYAEYKTHKAHMKIFVYSTDI